MEGPLYLKLWADGRDERGEDTPETTDDLELRSRNCEQ